MTEILADTLNNPIIPAIGLALAATAVALWVAAAWWAYHDATWRTGSTFMGLLAASWIVISSPLLMPFALGIYTLARPQHTAAESRSRRLVEELVEQLDAEGGGVCPTCAQATDVDWLRCPTCSTWLATPCANCGGWSDRSLDICPWCGNEERDEPQVELRQPAPAPGVPRKPRRRQSRRHPVGVMAFDARQPRGRLEALLDARPPARAGSR